MEIKDYFEDGRNAQKKYQREQQIRKQMPTVRFKPKKLEFYDPRLIIRGAGIVWEMIAPLFGKIATQKKAMPVVVGRRKSRFERMKGVVQKDADTVMVWLHLKAKKTEFGKYREFLDLAEEKE
jgi:hypothetical protein